MAQISHSVPINLVAPFFRQVNGGWKRANEVPIFYHLNVNLVYFKELFRDNFGSIFNIKVLS